MYIYIYICIYICIYGGGKPPGGLDEEDSKRPHIHLLVEHLASKRLVTSTFASIYLNIFTKTARF